MAKRKKDFPDLKFINPFNEKNLKEMVCEDWADQRKFIKWRTETANKFLKDPKLIEFLDCDELLTQWDVFPLDRRCNPDTCNMIFKELCLVLRMIDAEHQDAVFSEENKVPGVVYSASSNKYIYCNYDLEAEDKSKATKVKMFDTEEEAYEDYVTNRNMMISSTASKALYLGLIDPDVYNKYFGFSDSIAVRSYEYYKEEQYKVKEGEE